MVFLFNLLGIAFLTPTLIDQWRTSQKDPLDFNPYWFGLNVSLFILNGIFFIVNLPFSISSLDLGIYAVLGMMVYVIYRMVRYDGFVEREETEITSDDIDNVLN